MLEIKPFKAVTYSRKINLDSVVAPPYDVIDEEKRKQLCARSEYNITRVILPEGKDRYRYARDLLREWIRKNILLKESTPAIFIYEQVFNFSFI